MDEEQFIQVLEQLTDILEQGNGPATKTRLQSVVTKATELIKSTLAELCEDDEGDDDEDEEEGGDEVEEDDDDDEEEEEEGPYNPLAVIEGEA